MESVRMPMFPPAPMPVGQPAQRAAASHQPAPAEGQEEAVDITTSVRRAMQQSVSYQIIRRTFESKQKDFDEHSPPPEVPTAPQADNEMPAPVQATPPLPAADGLAAMEAVQVETRVLEVTSGNAAPEVERGDPLLLDLNGNGVETTGVQQGVRFDLDGNGIADIVSFATGGDAFLALDRNGNGRIDDGRELFGDQDGAVNGFEALRPYDTNGDGRIDALDPVFEKLQLVQADAQGRLATSWLHTAQVSSINLDYRDVRSQVNAYDEITQSGSYSLRDGSRGRILDVWIGFVRS